MSAHKDELKAWRRSRAIFWRELQERVGDAPVVPLVPHQTGLRGRIINAVDRFHLDERGALPLLGPARVMKSLSQDWVNMASTTSAVAPTPVSLTPTALGGSVARVFPFYMESALGVAKIYMSTPNAVSNCMQLGIFDGAGSQVYTSGTVSTSANITTITLSPSRKLFGGNTYYFAITNANLTSSTAAWWISPAASAATVPRWGTVSATSGAMPASITPGSITATVGGWPIYTFLSLV